MELQNSGAAPCGVATGVPDEGASETIVAVAVEGAGYLHVGKQIEWDSPAYREIGRMSHKTPSVDGQAPNHIQFMRSADQRPDRVNAACGCGKLHKNGQIAAGLDLALYQAVQPHFISVRFEGGDDPLSPQRWGFVPGDSDSFLLETETDTKVEELEFKDGDKTVTKKITSSEHYVVSGRGKDRRRISRRGERVAWPYNWRDRLALIPEHGFHATLLATTYALARELVRAIFADTVTPYFAEIDAAIDAAPRGGRSLGDIEERKDDVSRICSGMRLRSYELRKPNGLASAVKDRTNVS